MAKQQVFKERIVGGYKATPVLAYKVVETYQPSGMNSLLLELEDGRSVRILEPYFLEMQKSNFGKETD